MPNSKAVGLFPMRLLGFGLFLAWSALIASFEQAVGVAELSSPVTRFYIGSLLTAAGYLALAAACRNGRHDPWTRSPLIAAGLAAAACPLLEWAGATTGMFAFDLLGIVAKAMATVGLFLAWNTRISAYQPRTAQTAYAGSLALGAAVYFLANALDPSAVAACTAALPLASTLLLIMSAVPLDEFRTGAEGDDAAEGLDAGAGADRVVWKIPWHLVVLVIAFSFAQQLVGHCDGRALQAYEWGRLVVALCVLVPLVAAFDSFDMDLLAKLCPTLLVAALVMCGLHGFDDPFGVKKLLASMGYYGFSLYMYFMLSSLSYRFNIPAGWLFGAVWAGDAAAGPFGATVGNWLNAADAAGEFLVVDAVTGAAAVLLVLLTLLLLAGRTFGDAWGLKGTLLAGDPGRGGDPAGTDGGEGAAGAQRQAPGRSATSDYLRERVQRCESVARRFGLTHREEEVLSLLVEGQSFQQVEATLTIAHGTMRAHVQHIYAKLDVHSADEVRQFVAEWRA